jgi:hypothetical protein
MRVQIISAGLFIILLLLIVTVVFVLISARHQPPPPATATSQVTWSEAVIILRSGQVKVATQTHQRDVIFVLKNGQIIQTVEPEIDELFREIRYCGAVCAGITQATE